MKRIYIRNAAYLITMVTRERISFFSEEIFCNILIDNIGICQKIKPFKLIGFKINLEHVHLIIQPIGKFTISQIVWSKLNRWQVIEETEDHIESMRASLVPSMGNDLKGLMVNVENQEGYAQHALKIAQLVTHHMEAIDQGPGNRNR